MRELKENFSGKELELISKTILILQKINDTRMGDSLYWSDILEIDLETKEFLIDIESIELIDDKTYYALLGLATSFDFKFEEVYYEKLEKDTSNNPSLN